MSAPYAPVSALSVPAFRLRVADINPHRPVEVDIAPDAALRAKLAEALDLTALPMLRLRGRLVASGAEDWVLEARMEAEVVQPCVVSLRPVTSHLDEELHRRWTPDLPEPDGDEVEMGEGDDEVDALGPVIDLGAVLAEALALALPPWPRAKDAEMPAAAGDDGGQAVNGDDEGRRPFADLARLLEGRGKG